jgi:hypothetical protein
MYLRLPLIAAILALFTTFSPAFAGGKATSKNFIVYAPTQELADKFADAAEYYRVEKAREWLGRELPNWSTKCPLTISVSMGQPSGATTFTFEESGNGRSFVSSREMKIKGKLDALLDSVLPHEITHTVFADYFGKPVPRWADEGGSVLSENEDERYNHDIKCRQILNAGRAISLRVLFAMKEYPDDMIVTYAEGYSVSQYLIDLGGRKKFLDFIEAGMKKNNRNWEEAVKDIYGINSVNQLESDWIDSLKRSRTIAARSTPSNKSSGQMASRGRDVRSDAAPGVPLLEAPVVARGASPSSGSGSYSAPSPNRTRPPAPAPSPAPYRSSPQGLLGNPEPSKP